MKQCSMFILVILFISCSGPRETLIFSSSRDGDSNIYSMDQKGKNVKKLTTLKEEEWGPTWINKNEISFLRQEDDRIKIVSLNLETNEEKQIEHPDNCIIDDKNILFSNLKKTKLFACRGNVFIHYQGQDRAVNLTDDISGTSNYFDWVDEQTILFTNDQEGNNEIYSLSINTRKLTRLTNNLANDERASISPNGKYLIFSSDRFEKGNQEILLLNLQNKAIQNISQNEGMDLIARWSKDGKRIYYGSNKVGNWEIYSYHINKQKTVRLTNNESFDGDPRVN